MGQFSLAFLSTTLGNRKKRLLITEHVFSTGNSSVSSVAGFDTYKQLNECDSRRPGDDADAGEGLDAQQPESAAVNQPEHASVRLLHRIIADEQPSYQHALQ